MTDPASQFVFLPGAGGGSPDLALLRANPADPSRFQTIVYPGWQSYVSGAFSAEALVTELAARIAAAVPEGPIRIIGLSLGGHFGYAAALRLQASGREVAGFCAIDSFMIESSEPSAGWKGRALAQALELVRQRRIGELFQFVQSRFWRALLRLAGDRLPDLLSKFGGPSGGAVAGSAADSKLKEELTMRLLIREVAPWVASLDGGNPTALKVPAILLRTRLTAGDDAAWMRRCPTIEIHEVPGGHHTLFDPPNVGALRDAFVTGTRQWA
jgi:thioesterase domain-containing protein